MIYQDITVIIASFHSRDKIFDCINSISKDVKIIGVENSNDENLKNEIYNNKKDTWYSVLFSGSLLPYTALFVRLGTLNEVPDPPYA